MPKSKPADPAVIEPSLLPLAVPIGKVQLWAANYHSGDVGALSESLKRWGQKKPIVAQASTRTVVAGNHVLKAAQALGWQRIAVVFADLSDEDAAAYAVADNRTATLGSNDDAMLSQLLVRLVKDGGPQALAGTGYDEDEVNALLERVAKEAADAGGEGIGVEDQYRCPKCGHGWSGDPRPAA